MIQHHLKIENHRLTCELWSFTHSFPHIRFRAGTDRAVFQPGRLRELRCYRSLCSLCLFISCHSLPYCWYVLVGVLRISTGCINRVCNYQTGLKYHLPPRLRVWVRPRPPVSLFYLWLCSYSFVFALFEMCSFITVVVLGLSCFDEFFTHLLNKWHVCNSEIKITSSQVLNNKLGL